MTAITVGIVVGVLGLALNASSVLILDVPEVDEAPILDGDLSDSAWAGVPELTISTSQGANFGGTGESAVNIRAIHDKGYIYFAFIWEDPTRSYKHLPLTKDLVGWHVARSTPNSALEERLTDDKFSVLLSPPTLPFLGAAIHLAARPIDGYPPSASGRGLHYVAPGKVVDVWVWRADHTGALGFLDDAHFAPPIAPTPDQLVGTIRYQGGFQNDAGPDCFVDNRRDVTVNGLAGIVPRRVPRDLEQTRSAMGELDVSADASEAEGARWWMTLEESVPYSPERDAAIAIGTTIPSVLAVCLPSGDVADVRAVGPHGPVRFIQKGLAQADCDKRQFGRCLKFALMLYQDTQRPSGNDGQIRGSFLMWPGRNPAPVARFRGGAAALGSDIILRVWATNRQGG